MTDLEPPVATEPPEEEDHNEADGKEADEPAHGLCPGRVLVTVTVWRGLVEDTVEDDCHLQNIGQLVLIVML